VLAVDRARRRIDLGMRQAAETPVAAELSAAPTGSRAGVGLFASLLKDVKVKK
jgi:ribosomal protein S1